MPTLTDQIFDTVFGNRTTITFAVERCCKCGIPFGIDTEHRKKLIETHADFYCPNGHGQRFIGKTEAEQKAERLARELESMKQSRDYHQHVAERERHSRITTAGHLTRKKKQLERVKNGVCPCCNRSFVDLHRHMQSKHPNFQPNTDHA